MSTSGGKILFERAYAQGKMLDHSSWNLDRGITPSDIDFFVESNGYFLYCELTKNLCDWGQISYGQKIALYRKGLLSDKVVVGLCQHDVPSDRQIDTKNDIICARIRYCLNKKEAVLVPWQYQEFVEQFSRSAPQALEFLDRVIGGQEDYPF